MAALIISGAANFLTPGSEVLQQGLDVGYHKIWAATIFISGLIALISSWWRDRVTGLLLERAGLWSLGVACPIYALIVYVQTGLSAGAPGITLTALIGVACIWRAIHVGRELRIVRAFMLRNY